MPRKFRSKTVSAQIQTAEKLAESAAAFRICLLHTNYCLPRTHAVTVLNCRDPFDPQIYAQQIALLKADLKAALHTLEVHEKALAATVKQASALALDEVEAGLKELLHEVEQKRKDRKRSG